MTGKKTTTQDQEAIAIEFFLSGMSTPQVAQRLGLTQAIVTRILRDHAIPLRKVGTQNRKTTIQTDQAIISLYQNGLSKKDVAEQTETTEMIVTRVLDNAHIQARSCAPIRPYNVFSQAFDTLDGEHEAYWLGFIYADGSVNRTCLNVVLALKDFDHLEKLAAFLGCEEQVKITPQNTAKLLVSDRYLSDRLRDLGIEPNRPRATRALECVPSNMQHHFLRGCFDGDGSALIKPQLMIVGRLPFLAAMQNILIAQASANPVTIKNEHDTWGKLHYKGIHRCLAIADYLYRDATIYLERKRERIDDWPTPQRGKQSRYWGS